MKKNILIKPLISIIVPVFNVESFVSDCLNSILKQDYPYFEVLLIDDGSRDGSGSICDSFAIKDSRIKVHHKTNGGLSSARNVGIALSKGEYLVFVDSDDILAEDYLSSFVRMIEITKCDVGICLFSSFSDKTNLKFQHGNRIEMVSKKKWSHFFLDLEYIVAWNKVYARTLFTSIRYPEGKLHEDVWTTYKLLDEASVIAMNYRTKYGYRYNENSITKSKYSIQKLDEIEGYENQVEYFCGKCEKQHIASLKMLLLQLKYHIQMCHENGFVVNEKELRRKYESYKKTLLSKTSLSGKVYVCILNHGLSLKIYRKLRYYRKRIKIKIKSFG